MKSNLTSDDKKQEPTIAIKQSEFELLIEMGCRARSLAWEVRNYRDKMQEGITIGMSISDVLYCEDDLNAILEEYPDFHKYD